MIQRRILFLLVMMFTVVFAYGQEVDENVKRLITTGVMYHDRGMYDEAILRYDSALAIAPNNSNAVSEKAFTLSAMGKVSEAKKMVEKQIKRADAKDLPTLYMLYAGILDDAGEHVKSIEIYEKAASVTEPNDFHTLQLIHYNAALALSRFADKDKQDKEKWADNILFNLYNSIKYNPTHAGSYALLGGVLSQETHSFCDAFLAEAMFAVQGGNRVDLIENEFAKWADLKLDSASGPKTTMAFNKVNEMMKSEPSEYGRLYDIFSTITPLLCPDTLGTPLPVAYTYDFFSESFMPFFAALNRQGFLECFFHVAMKNSKKKYITNADWVAKHKDVEDRMWEYIRGLPIFMKDIQYGFVVDSMSVNTAEEARMHNADIMGCCKYYLTHLSDTPDMDKAVRYILAWATASPDVSVNVCSFITNLIAQNEKYHPILVSYIAGCSFAALASGEKNFTQDVFRAGMIDVIARYATEKEKLGKNDELEKLQNLFENDKDGFEKFIEENYNK